MSDDFAVVRDSLRNIEGTPLALGFIDVALAALDRIEARLARLKEDADQWWSVEGAIHDYWFAQRAMSAEEAVRRLLAERDEARADVQIEADVANQMQAERDELRADAERLAEALRVAADDLTAIVESCEIEGYAEAVLLRPMAERAHAALAAHEPADPDADYLHGIGMTC